MLQLRRRQMLLSPHQPHHLGPHRCNSTSPRTGIQSRDQPNPVKGKSCYPNRILQLATFLFCSNLIVMARFKCFNIILDCFNAINSVKFPYYQHVIITLMSHNYKITSLHACAHFSTSSLVSPAQILTRALPRSVSPTSGRTTCNQIFTRFYQNV